MVFSTRLAAIDLGSNSFHLLLAQRLPDGGYKVVARQRQKVRLADGLQANGELDQAAIERGVACLEGFRNYLAGGHVEHIRCVATAALRQASNKAIVIAAFEQALGVAIELISGQTEAELIYQGATAALENPQQAMLVLDIGGASSEIIAGNGVVPHYLESLNMGCVIWQNRYFADGLISTASMQQAVGAAAALVAPFSSAFQRYSWQAVVGASGTFRALYDILQRDQHSHIDTLWLHEVAQRAQQLGHCHKLGRLGIRKDRQAVFMGGLAILLGIIEHLPISRIELAQGALREGLAQQLALRPAV
jgi:exopolyphosphatase/guanosine-5'-triphosphate,3'-diphosphate pyrophosphatase